METEFWYTNPRYENTIFSVPRHFFYCIFLFGVSLYIDTINFIRHDILPNKKNVNWSKGRVYYSDRSFVPMCIQIIKRKQGRSETFGIEEVKSAIAKGAGRKEGLGVCPKKILKSRSSEMLF